MTEDERKAFQERIQQSDLSAFSSIGSPLPGTGIYYNPEDRAQLTPAQTTYIASIFAPGAGVVDAAGQFPEFPGPDVALEDAFAGDPMPSISENIAAGGIDRYVIAPLQGLGVLGDATYAAPFVGPVLGPTVGSVLKGVGALSAVPGMIGKAKKTSTGIEALKGTDATKAALKENLDKFAKDQYGFVSPSLEALLKSAPPNLKGKQITEWLNANANKGVKPKELEYLGIDEFVAANPKATINEVVEGVSNNKVVVGRTVYGDEGSFLRFDVTEPKIDPTTGKPPVDGKNPYEMITPKGDPNITEQNIYAYGNDTEGYLIMSNGEDITNQLDPPYSRAEAQIQLQRELENMGFRNTSEGATRYKSYIDETLPGGDNYREVVFQWEEAPMLHNVQDHFQEMNQISSALIRNRKLADGKQTLHVDELQSDLHTKGSRDGYRVPEAEFNRIKQEIDPLLEGTPFTLIRHAADDQPGLAFAREGDLDGFVDLQKFDTLASKGNVEDSIKYDAGRSQKVLSELGEEKFDKFVEKIRPLIGEGQIPNYPFKDDWYAMSLKQLLMDAIEEGSDAISVSSSAPIKARYTDEYSKFYETLYDQKIPSAMKKLANKYGGKFEKGKLDVNDVAESSGGNFLVELENKFLDSDAYVKSGLNIDDNLQETRKLYNEYENKYFETNIIRITPEMKKKILEEGFSNFAIGGAVLKPFSIDNIDIFNS